MKQEPVIIKTIFKGLDFGSYCTIEMKRYGSGGNEFYIHKVIGCLESNAYVKIPIDYGPNGTGHKEVLQKESLPVLRVVCCGILETDIFKVAVKDVIPGKYFPKPTNFVHSGINKHKK